MTTITRTHHDATRGDLCGCDRCDAGRLARLAVSYATSASQQALWHPRSRRLAEAAHIAQTHAAEALARYRSSL